MKRLFYPFHPHRCCAHEGLNVSQTGGTKSATHKHLQILPCNSTSGTDTKNRLLLKLIVGRTDFFACKRKFALRCPRGVKLCEKKIPTIATHVFLLETAANEKASNLLTISHQRFLILPTYTNLFTGLGEPTTYVL